MAYDHGKNAFIRGPGQEYSALFRMDMDAMHGCFSGLSILIRADHLLLSTCIFACYPYSMVNHSEILLRMSTVCQCLWIGLTGHHKPAGEGN